MDYRSEMLRTVPPDLDERTRLNIAAMGLCGEAGEVSEQVKKYLFHGKPLDLEEFIKELGDVRWYLELAAYCVGVSMSEVEQRNASKLRRRYPDGFKGRP